MVQQIESQLLAEIVNEEEKPIQIVEDTIQIDDEVQILDNDPDIRSLNDILAQAESGRLHQEVVLKMT